MCNLKGVSVAHVFVHCEVTFFYDRSYIGRLGSLFCQNHMAFGKGKRTNVLWGGCMSATWWLFGCFGWKENEEILKTTYVQG